VDHGACAQNRADRSAGGDDVDPAQGAAGEDDPAADHGQQLPGDEQRHLTARDGEDAGHRVRDDEVREFGVDPPFLGPEHGQEYLCEHGSEQEDDKSDAEKPYGEHYLSRVDSFRSAVAQLFLR